MDLRRPGSRLLQPPVGRDLLVRDPRRDLVLRGGRLLERPGLRLELRHLHLAVHPHLGFFAILFGSSLEAESLPLFLAFVIFMYLNYPGVRDHFVQTEMALLTHEQRAAMQQMAAANAAAAGMSV